MAALQAPVIMMSQNRAGGKRQGTIQNKILCVNLKSGMENSNALHEEIGPPI